MRKKPKLFIYEANMRVTHIEHWTVEAANEDEARMKLANISDDLFEDVTGGEVTDWEITSLRKAREYPPSDA